MNGYLEKGARLHKHIIGTITKGLIESYREEEMQPLHAAEILETVCMHTCVHMHLSAVTSLEGGVMEGSNNETLIASS